MAFRPSWDSFGLERDEERNCTNELKNKQK